MKALRGNGKRALAVVAAAVVAVGADSQAMSSPRAPAQKHPPGFSSSAAVKSMRARHAALAKLGEVAQGAPREGLTQSRQAPVPEPTVVTSTPSGDAFDWGDFGIGAGAMLGFVLLLTGLSLGAVAMRHRTGKLETT